MRLERVEDQLIESLLQRERVVLAGGFHEILHVEERASDLLMQFLQDRGFATAGSAGEPYDRADGQSGGEIIKCLLLRRAEGTVGALKMPYSRNG
jgi:hypothetical protein